MEEIQKFLTGFEKIIWHKVEIKDKSISSLKKLLIYTSIFYIILLFPLLLFIQILLEQEPMIAFLLAIPLSFLYTSVTLIRSDKKKMQKYNLTRKELIEYKETWVLTNKRWIQKNLDKNDVFYPEDLPPNTLERQNDIIFANLDAVKAVMIGKTDPEVYRIWIYIDESFTEYTDPNLGVELESWEDYENFMYNFKKVVPLDEPEEENAGYGVSFTYYLTQKFKKEFNGT